jgi:superfamily II DNA or RNA helicase
MVRGRIKQCALTFQRLVTSAKFVIVADAFLSSRSTETFYQMGLRGKVSEYTHQAIKRKAFYIKSKKDFFNRIIYNIQQGKKAFLFCATKAEADKFVKMLKKTNINFLYYRDGIRERFFYSRLSMPSLY